MLHLCRFSKGRQGMQTVCSLEYKLFSLNHQPYLLNKNKIMRTFLSNSLFLSALAREQVCKSNFLIPWYRTLFKPLFWLGTVKWLLLLLMGILIPFKVKFVKGTWQMTFTIIMYTVKMGIRGFPRWHLPSTLGKLPSWLGQRCLATKEAVVPVLSPSTRRESLDQSTQWVKRKLVI